MRVVSVCTALDRDRSQYNGELSTVTELLATRYRVEAVEVLA